MNFIKKLLFSKGNQKKAADIYSPSNDSGLSHKELLALLAAPASTKTAEELLKLGASTDPRIRKEQLLALAKFLLISHANTEERQVLIGVSICPKCEKATTYTTTPAGKKDMPSLCLNCKSAATTTTWWEAPMLRP